MDEAESRRIAGPLMAVDLTVGENRRPSRDRVARLKVLNEGFSHSFLLLTPGQVLFDGGIVWGDVGLVARQQELSHFSEIGTSPMRRASVACVTPIGFSIEFLLGAQFLLE